MYRLILKPLFFNN